MKYAQLLIGLFAGTALGGAVVASTGPDVLIKTNGSGGGSSNISREEIKQIVKETLNDDPKMIIDAVQKYQETMRKKQTEGVSEQLKDPAIRKEIYDAPNLGSIGPKDAKKVIVEFFDYDCPACKMMFKGIDQLVKTNKDVRVIFHEYPIFGDVSEKNSKIGLAVAKLYPEKYWNFHVEMMQGPGHNGSEAKTLAVVKKLGMDVEKVKATAATKEVEESLAASRKVGEKLGIQGTPTLIVGDEFIPHAMGYDDLAQKVDAIK